MIKESVQLKGLKWGWKYSNPNHHVVVRLFMDLYSKTHVHGLLQIIYDIYFTEQYHDYLWLVLVCVASVYSLVYLLNP